MYIGIPALVTFLVLGQALGALIGAGMAVWSEIVYVQALRDGKVDHAERAHLKAIGRGLRFGMTILLVSSIGLVISAYVSENTLHSVLTTSFWTLVTLALIILSSSWLLSRKRASFLVSSATAFTAWWFLVYLTFGKLPTASPNFTVLFFVVAVFFFGLVLYGNRKFAALY